MAIQAFTTSAIRVMRGFLVLSAIVSVAGFGLATESHADSITITFENGAFAPDPPGGGFHGPHDWIEQGIVRYGGLWQSDVGTPGGFTRPEADEHTHILWDDFAFSLVDVPHSWRNDIQGGLVEMVDGSEFSLVSIDYRLIRREPWEGADPLGQFYRLPWSYGLDDAQLILSTDVNPATADFASYESQWSAYSIDDGSQFDLGGGNFDPWRTAIDSPWQTLEVTGFDNITKLFISHTAHEVQFDNIVIEFGGGAVPEPGTGVLLSLGLGLLAARRAGARHHSRRP